MNHRRAQPAPTHVRMPGRRWLYPPTPDPPSDELSPAEPASTNAEAVSVNAAKRHQSNTMTGVAVGPEPQWFGNPFACKVLLQSDHISWQSNTSKKLPPTATFSGDLRRRMAAIEQKLHERAGNASLSCPAMPCSLVDVRLKKPKNAPLCLIFSQAQDASKGGERAPHLVSPS
jgi:hypothetical protein